MLGIDLEKAIDFKVYMPLLEAWFWGEMHKVACVPPPPGNPLAPTKVLMGCPLWGDEYVARFTKLCLPTIMSAKNKAALQGRCRVVLFTDVLGFPGLYYLARDMTQAGLETTVHVIPQEIMSKVGNLPLNKYWLLGVVQQLLIQMAGKAGMAFHQLHPDHLFAPEYYPNMFRIADANPGIGIAQTGISADIHACLEELEAFRQEDGSLVIPDRELGDLGWRHLHKQMKGNVMGRSDLATDMPNSHYLFWVGKDKLHVNCCHMNAVWIPPEKTAKAPIKLYNALDTMLPAFMPETVYIPDDQDGLTFLEVSDEKKNESAARVDFATYAAQAWNTVHLSDDWTPFFEAACEIPIKEQAEYTEEAEIKKQHATVCVLLKEAKPAVTEMLQAAQRKQDERIAALKAEAAMGGGENGVTPMMVDRKAQAEDKRLRKKQRRAEGAVHAQL